MRVVLTTVGSKIDASNLARQLVERKLAGCVQIIPKIKSVYFWKGEVVEDKESLLLIKTDGLRYTELKSFLQSEHPYETPEILSIDSDDVSDGYRQWLEGVLDGNSE